jgi:predicted dehydrogenase
MDRERIKVAIIGCGRIGAQWDAQAPAPAHSLTHAAAFSRHPQASVVAVCDRDFAKAQQAMRRWGALRAYGDVGALFAEQAVDIAVIASPSGARAEVVDPALAAGVAVLVIEKPLATTLGECRRLAAAIEAAGCKSLVNFSRHWDPSMQELRSAIEAGSLGAVQRLIGTYGKGLVNNGSHLIDLAGLLCRARPLRARALGSPLDPGESAWSGGQDPTCDAQIVYARENGTELQLSLVGTDHRAYTCFELRLIGSRALCDVTRGGRRLILTSIEDDPNFDGYRIPGGARDLPAQALQSMDRMADEAVRLAQGTLQRADCDAPAALQTALAVEAVRRSAHANGAWVELAAIERNSD